MEPLMEPHLNAHHNVLTSMPRHSVSVVGIVIDVHDRILVIKRRDNGHWQPPGGVLELHETLEQGVCREVAEETGVQVEVGRLSGVYKNVKDGIIAVTFRCRPLTEAVSQTSEAAQITWIDTADVSRLMTPTFAARVLDAFEPMPQVRAHDGTNLLR